MKSTSTTSQPIGYNEEKVSSGEAYIIGIFNKDERDSDIEETFERLERKNISSTNVSFHMSISPGADESMSDEQAKAFASELMQKLGYGNQPFIIYKHDDIERVHYHVVSIRIDQTGHKIPERLEHKRCQEALRTLCREYGFQVGNGERERQRMDNIDVQRFVPGSNVLQQMKAIFEECCRYHMTSFNQFKLIMRAHGIDVDERTGESTKLVLRGLDSEGKPCTAPVTEAELKMNMYELYASHARDCVAQSRILAREKGKVSNLIEFCLPHSQSEKHFMNMLKKYDIDMYLHRTKDGKIFGATFIDNATKCAFKCSELGSEHLPGIQKADERGQWHKEDKPDEKKAEQQEQSQQNRSGVTLGDFFYGLGAGGSKSKSKDMKDKKKKKPKIKM